jgi:hypothetical protein
MEVCGPPDIGLRILQHQARRAARARHLAGPRAVRLPPSPWAPLHLYYLVGGLEQSKGGLGGAVEIPRTSPAQRGNWIAGVDGQLHLRSSPAAPAGFAQVEYASGRSLRRGIDRRGQSLHHGTNPCIPKMTRTARKIFRSRLSNSVPQIRCPGFLLVLAETGDRWNSLQRMLVLPIQGSASCSPA